MPDIPTVTGTKTIRELVEKGVFSREDFIEIETPGGQSYNLKLGTVIDYNPATGQHEHLINREYVDSHPMSAITGLVVGMAGKASLVHLHIEADITDLDKYSQAEITALLATKSAVTHVHNASAIVYNNTTGMTATEVQAAIDELYAGGANNDHDLMDNLATANQHPIAAIIGLQTALNAKSDDGHAHGWTEITSKPSTYPPSTHAHPISDVTNLQTTLDGKSNTSHGHPATAISYDPAADTYITGIQLQAALGELDAAITGLKWLPNGGITGDLIIKQSGVDGDVAWGQLATIDGQVVDIKTKREVNTGVVPGAGTLALGELFVNITDQLMWIGDASGDPIALGGGVEWGAITGTLSDQTDLQAALDAKVDVGGDTMTGALVLSGDATLALHPTTKQQMDTALALKEAADATILKDADIGGSVQAYDVDTAKLDVAQEWDRAQSFNETALTSGTTIAWNGETKQVCRLALEHNGTMSAPSNVPAGRFIQVTIDQSTTASNTLAWNAVFIFQLLTPPVVPTAANAWLQITFKSDGTNLIEQGRTFSA